MSKEEKPPEGGKKDLRIPDHIGAVHGAPPPPPGKQRPGTPAEPRKNKIHLGPVEGSELHLAQLAAALVLKEMDKATLKSQLHEARRQWADTELQLLMKTLGEEQKKLQELMTRLQVPEGWKIIRNDDGTYTIAKPPPPQPQPPPPR